MGIFLAGLSLAAAGYSGQAPAPAHPLAVSAAIDSYPYSFEERGKMTGFAVDVFEAVAQRMDLKYDLVRVAAMDDLRRFAAGDFDIGQWQPHIPGRDSDAEYSVPILTVQGAIFVRKGDRRFKTMTDLRDQRARIATPTQGHVYAMLKGLAPALVREVSSPEALQLLASGQVDAVLVTRLTGLAQAQHLGIANVEPVGPSLEGFTVRYCFATHRGNAALMAQLNEGLAILYRTGEYERIHQKWFARYEPQQFTREQVVAYVAGTLALALVIALWALIRQRQLRQRIAHQAEELDESRTILAEAQRFARLGYWQRGLPEGDSPEVWSEETYRIFERAPQKGIPSLESVIGCAVAADRERWREAVRAVYVQGQPYDLYLAIEPQPGLRKIIHVRGRPIVDQAGRRIGTFGTVQDVTAWRAAEEALRQSEQLLRAFYENLPLALGVVERAGGEWLVVSLNPEGVRQFGLAAEPPAGRAMSSLGLAPEWAQYWSKLFTRCVDSAQPLKTDVSREDQRRNYAVTLVPLDPAADRARCCFLVEDVTERKQKDAEIAQGRRLRAIGELVGGIAHEFNNLLTPILLNSDLLQAEWAHMPGLRDDLKMIADAARRSADLTRRLLAFGRKSEHQAEDLDLHAVVQANFELVRHTFDRRIQLKDDIPANLPALFLNSGDLHQILLNLLVNSRDTLTEKLAGPHAPDWIAGIRLEATLLPAAAAVALAPGKHPPPAQWIRLTVRDNGCGMPPSVLERIFEPFYTTKQIGHGTGLGLATVWHVVAEFGGRIDAESTLGEGTAFHLCLPVRPRAPLAGSLHPFGGAAPATSPKPRKLLLAEDEEPVSRIVTALLRREGHTVVLATDGHNAWQQLSAAPAEFDAVIMDLNMPGLSGMELARRARALPYDRPLVVMSGRVTEDERIELACLRIDAIINKPFTLEMLRAMLDSVLADSPPPPSAA
jgi:two-component system cell cycle sensor histidine kinase/response regulator CckA